MKSSFFRSAGLGLRASAAVLLGTSLFATTPPPSPDEAAWGDLRERRFTDSVTAFAAASKTGGADARALAAGHAVALLNMQPRTRDNVARADAILASLAEGDDRDDIALTARYLRARVAEVHLFEPDLKLASGRYAALIAAAPAHPAAQAAVVKRVVLHIYRMGNDPVGALATAEAWGTSLTDAAARRDYHLTMARSYLFFKTGRERALAHLQEAFDAGVIAPANSASTLISLAELARELGRRDIARAAYERFLRTHLRDQRVYMIRQRLAELNGAGTSEAALAVAPPGAARDLVSR